MGLSEPPNIAHHEDLYFFRCRQLLRATDRNLSIERRSIHMKAKEKAAEKAVVPYNKRAVIGIILCGLILGVIMGLFTIFSPE